MIKNIWYGGKNMDDDLRTQLQDFLEDVCDVYQVDSEKLVEQLGIYLHRLAYRVYRYNAEIELIK